eukprot:TRINITY_DN8414_c0_g1_i5.p1 TRINITY_DN8414_c0_g1~~TRINITY_DN8414_c0_g1_i5.p1  ORF type:complete len:182 (+),score=32.83 TRINITY_DN8414_c0_g1_i5:260-805(+)
MTSSVTQKAPDRVLFDESKDIYIDKEPARDYSDRQALIYPDRIFDNKNQFIVKSIHTTTFEDIAKQSLSPKEKILEKYHQERHRKLREAELHDAFEWPGDRTIKREIMEKKIANLKAFKPGLAVPKTFQPVTSIISEQPLDEKEYAKATMPSRVFERKSWAPTHKKPRLFDAELERMGIYG